MRTRAELEASVDAVRDDPDLTNMARIIKSAHSEARFQGFGDWDQARLIADALHSEGYRREPS